MVALRAEEGVGAPLHPLGFDSTDAGGASRDCLRTLLTLMLPKTERGQRPAPPEEALLPWRAPGLGKSPMVTGRRAGLQSDTGVASPTARPGRWLQAPGSGWRETARAGGAGPADGELGGADLRRRAARRLSERVRAQKFL